MPITQNTIRYLKKKHDELSSVLSDMSFSEHITGLPEPLHPIVANVRAPLASAYDKLDDLISAVTTKAEAEALERTVRRESMDKASLAFRDATEAVIGLVNDPLQGRDMKDMSDEEVTTLSDGLVAMSDALDQYLFVRGEPKPLKEPDTP